MPPFDPYNEGAPPNAANSSFIGFLLPNLPIASAPYNTLSGQSLDNFMQFVISGITGVPPDLVRPRWQPEPPNLPSIGTSWVATGVTRTTPLGYPAFTELSTPTGLGSNKYSDKEEFDVLSSCYGPNADALAIRIRNGFMTDQNRECLQLMNIGLINTSGRQRVPTLVQGRFLERIDITVTFRREVREYYPVLYLLSAPVEVYTDVGAVDPSP